MECTLREVGVRRVQHTPEHREHHARSQTDQRRPHGDERTLDEDSHHGGDERDIARRFRLHAREGDDDAVDGAEVAELREEVLHPQHDITVLRELHLEHLGSPTRTGLLHAPIVAEHLGVHARVERIECPSCLEQLAEDIEHPQREQRENEPRDPRGLVFDDLVHEPVVVGEVARNDEHHQSEERPHGQNMQKPQTVHDIHGAPPSVHEMLRGEPQPTADEDADGTDEDEPEEITLLLFGQIQRQVHLHPLRLAEFFRHVIFHGGSPSCSFEPPPRLEGKDQREYGRSCVAWHTEPSRNDVCLSQRVPETRCDTAIPRSLSRRYGRSLR